jgi:hypothetical protein
MSYFEFIDEFRVEDFSEEHEVFGETFIWKRAEWSTMLRTTTTGDIGLFLEFKNSLDLPNDFREPVQYKYSLLTMDNVLKCTGKFIPHHATVYMTN